MPADGFPFAVRVGREKNFVRGLCFLANAFENIAPSAERDIFRFEALVDFNADLAFGQIAHMAVRGHDLELAS